jgi:homoserine dehydrogenase
VALGYHLSMAGQGGLQVKSVRSRSVGRRRLRVVVLGAGTVGREVVRALRSGWGAESLELTGVAARDLAKAEAAGMPAELLTDAPAHLVANEADVVVELMGGEEPARTLIAAALGAGLPVVTANKYVIARHGAALEAEARRTGAPFRFEAAVMGGTPILRLLADDLPGTQVLGFRGIVHGTTNHLLTEMAARGLGYDEALAGAQAAGYAEANPADDVEGGDAADKLVILARLAFGVWLDRASVATNAPDGLPGITGVTAADLASAARSGCAIRLLAIAGRADDGSIAAGVMPTAVDVLAPISAIAGVRNRVDIHTDRLGWISLEGPGAGGSATAGAVLADLGAVLAHRASTWGALPAASSGVAHTPEPVEWFDGPSGARYPVVR